MSLTKESSNERIKHQVRHAHYCYFLTVTRSFFFCTSRTSCQPRFFFFYTRVLERLRKNNETRQITHFTQTLERFTVTTPAVIRPSSSTSFRPEKNGFCNRPDLGKCNDLSFLFHTRKYSSDFGVPQKSIKGA